MRTAQHIFRSLTAALAATASLLLCLAVSCRRAPAPLPDDFGVTVLIDNPSSSDGTKAIADNEINSIAIFAFSGSELVGYVYESVLKGKTTFPMTLKASGAIDFYAIANPDPGYFCIVDAGGQPIDLKGTSDANPPEYDGTGINNWRVEINNDASSIPGEAAPWYAPMSNLSGAGGTNRRYTIDPDDNWTVIPLELTRAVSKIEVWFRSNDNYTEPPSGLISEPDESDIKRRFFYSIDGMKLIMPVASSGLYGTSQSSTSDNYEVDVKYKGQNEEYGYSYITIRNGIGFESMQEGVYSEKYFEHIWSYYIFPNMFGGNTAGENVGSEEDVKNYTTLKINYSRWEEDGYYEEGWLWKEYNWEVTCEPRDDKSPEKSEKTIYLPACERNTVVKVWSNLNDNTDRSFTYTVVDWDETVEVNVPDFE